MVCIVFTVPKLTAYSDSPSSYALNPTPCGESFFERDSSITTPSYRSADKENNSSLAFGNIRRQSDGNNALQVANVPCSSVSPVSVVSTSMVDHTCKDSLVLTELLDSSDDEWANTSALAVDSGKKMSSTFTGLGSSSSKFNSMEFTPSNQKGVASSSFQATTVQNKKCNSLNSSFSPQRMNTIPNNGNDSKLVTLKFRIQLVIVYRTAIYHNLQQQAMDQSTDSSNPPTLIA